MCKDKYDIIILGGQSNAEGYGLGAVSEEYIPDERIVWMNDKANPHYERYAGQYKGERK